MSHKPSSQGAPAPFKRSNEPIFWSMFGGGGVMSALFGPALILITLILVPLGILFPPETLSYARVLSFVQWWPGKLAIFVLVWLFMFHAMHRLGFTLHDLGVPGGHTLKAICYTFAGIITLICGYILLQI